MTSFIAELFISMHNIHGCTIKELDNSNSLVQLEYFSSKELDRRRVNKAQSANQNKGLNNDVQNACELLIIKILQILLNQA